MNTSKLEDNSKPCVHIGLPKTATTTLQTCLFPNHSGIDYLGKIPRTRQRYRNHDVQEVISGILTPPSRPRDLNRLRELYVDRILPKLDPNKVPLWSSEDITAGGPRHKQSRAEGFGEVFGECRVILVIRHPLRFAQSMYFQKLRETQTRENARFAKAGQYYEIGWWLEQCFALTHCGALSNLDYKSTIDAFAEVFGQSAIGIFLFEQLVEDQPAFIQKLCSFIGIDQKEGVALTANQKRNIQLTQRQLELIQEIANSPIRSLLFRLSTINRRNRILRGQPSPSDRKAKVEIPAVWKTRLEDLTREGNRELVEKWGLPLEKYGYPL